MPNFDEPRFTSAILTVPETASLVDMPTPTLQSWVGQRKSRPKVVTRYTPLKRGWPSIPLVGLVEASVLRGLLDQGLARREIYATVDHLRREYGSPFPFADHRLMTDGSLVYALQNSGAAYRVATDQYIFVEAVKEHFRPIVFGEDDFPTAYRVPGMDGVEIDPRFNSGRWSFERNRVPLFAVAGSLQAGESETAVMEAFGLDRDEVRLVERNLEWVAQAA